MDVLDAVYGRLKPFIERTGGLSSVEDVPPDAEDYVHRVGRTARAEATGVAITFVNGDDLYRLKKIEVLIGSEIHRIPNPEWLGEGPDPANVPKKDPHDKRKFKRKGFGDKKKEWKKTGLKKK